MSDPREPVGDGDLVRRAARSGEAFRLLFRRHQKAVLNFAHRFGADPEEAEEVVQETFLRVFRHLGRFDPERAFEPWLYAIAANVCRTRRSRDPRIRHRPAGDLVDRGTADPAHGPDERAHANEIGSALRQAVAALPEDQRLVFVLARYQGLDYGQVAEALEVPVGTVKSRMFRAVRTLRRELEDLTP